MYNLLTNPTNGEVISTGMHGIIIVASFPGSTARILCRAMEPGTEARIIEHTLYIFGICCYTDCDTTIVTYCTMAVKAQ